MKFVVLKCFGLGSGKSRLSGFSEADNRNISYESLDESLKEIGLRQAFLAMG